MKTQTTLTPIVPPTELYSIVLKRIYIEKRKYAERRLWYTGTLMFFSSIALVEAFVLMMKNLSHSGFYSYFSLIFSDGSTVVSYWKEFSFSLLESFSFTECIVVLAFIFVLLMLIKNIIKNVKIMSAPLSVATT